MDHFKVKRRTVLRVLPVLFGATPAVADLHYRGQLQSLNDYTNNRNLTRTSATPYTLAAPDVRTFRIVLVGIGDSGSNVVKHLIDVGIQGIEYIFADTDPGAVSPCEPHRGNKLNRRGLGAEVMPDRKLNAAKMAVADIGEAIAGSDLVFITAGESGTSMASLIARVAKSMDILTVGIATIPFNGELDQGMTRTETEFSELALSVDTLIMVPHEQRRDVQVDSITQSGTSGCINDMLMNTIGGIAEIIRVPGHVNVDFDDIRTVLGEHSSAFVGAAVATGPDRARIATERAMTWLMLNGMPPRGARRVLVILTASKSSLKLGECQQALTSIRVFTSTNTHIIFGTTYEESLRDQIRVTVIASRDSI